MIKRRLAEINLFYLRTLFIQWVLIEHLLRLQNIFVDGQKEEKCSGIFLV